MMLRVIRSMKPAQRIEAAVKKVLAGLPHRRYLCKRKSGESAPARWAMPWWRHLKLKTGQRDDISNVDFGFGDITMMKVGFIGWRGMVGSVLMQRMQPTRLAEFYRAVVFHDMA